MTLQSLSLEPRQGIALKWVPRKRWKDWLRGVDLNHRPLGYEPSTLSLIWRNLTSFWVEKGALSGPNFGPKNIARIKETPHGKYSLVSHVPDGTILDINHNQESFRRAYRVAHSVKKSRHAYDAGRETSFPPHSNSVGGYGSLEVEASRSRFVARPGNRFQTLRRLAVVGSFHQAGLQDSFTRTDTARENIFFGLAGFLPDLAKCRRACV